MISLPRLYSNGTVAWVSTCGKLHNLSGPALVRKDGTTEYWVNGVEADSLTQLLIKNTEQAKQNLINQLADQTQP